MTRKKMKKIGMNYRIIFFCKNRNDEIQICMNYRIIFFVKIGTMKYKYVILNRIENDVVALIW